MTLLLAALATSGCRHEAPATTSPEVARTAQIPWFEGSVEEAFALAKQERKSVFLYWGAVWCPPCHALRTKLFTRPDFVARLENAIPVYLDGDTDRAQIWGEKLNTYGYPTVIILDPDGKEITRIQGTLSVEEYGDAVSRAIASSRPIGDILAAVESGGAASIDPAELGILAFHSYGQDRTLDLGIERRRALFEALRNETPADLAIEKSRFLTLELFALAASDDETPAAEPGEKQRAELLGAVNATLRDRALRNANLDLVLYGSTTVVKLLTPDKGDTRDQLITAWNEAATAVRADESLSTDDRLTALLPRIRLATLDAAGAGEDGEPEVPEEIRNEVRESVTWAGSVVKDEDEMQAVMNTMAGLLEDAGLQDEAGSLLADKMSETTAPYYYMGWLAGIEAESGEKEKAVDLYRQAWLSAKSSGGAASMSAFRWGSSYLRRAMQHTPDNVDGIRADTETIVGDLVGGPDAFAGGNWSRLEGLGTAMESWVNESPDARGVVIDKLVAQVNEACERFPVEGPDSPGARCRSFLANES
jgi:thiol-disulfide isomerase/thioredoxin